jgi:hypothetical protein
MILVVVVVVVGDLAQFHSGDVSKSCSPGRSFMLINRSVEYHPICLSFHFIVRFVHLVLLFYFAPMTAHQRVPFRIPGHIGGVGS